MLAALVLASALHATPVRQLPGPFCLVAASAMALEAVGRPVPQRELARSVRMHADGTSYLELQRAARRYDVETLVFRARDDAEVIGLVRAGAPLVLGLGEGNGKHAIVLLGIEDDRWRIVDPRVGEEQRLAPGARPEGWVEAGRQVFAFIPPDETAPALLRRAGFAPKPFLARDRRYRAEAWRLEAARLPERDERRQVLLERAAAAERGEPEMP